MGHLAGQRGARPPDSQASGVQHRGALILGTMALALLAGCAQLEPSLAPPPGGSGASTDPTRVAAPPPDAITVEDFDTTSAEDRAAAASGPEAGTEEDPLGTTIASLGDATQPGFWAETPLVSTPRPGLLTYAETGLSVQVELRPSGTAAGSGTRVSLPAMRVLQAPLTALPELSVTGL